MATFPAHLRYTVEHEWVDGTDTATVGITDTATDALGDLVFVELPEVGARVTAGDVFGEVESTKSVSELYAPVSGEVTEVNAAAVEDPALVGRDPYGEGWLIKVQVSDLGQLLSAEEYAAHVEG